MENGISAFLDKLFESSNKNYHLFLSYFANYLRYKTDFYSGDYEQILRAAFFDSDKFSKEVSPRPIHFDGIDSSDTCFVPDSPVNDDTACDLFHDETQNVSNINHESVIIPETQFDPDDPNNSNSSCISNEHYKPIGSKIAEKNKSSVNNGTEGNGEENSDFFKVAADPNNCEPQITSLESQPIMANLDRSLLDNFLSSDDSSSALSSTRIEGNVSKVAKQNGQTSQRNSGSKADNRRQTGEWSHSTTPDIDFEEIDKLVDKSVASAKVPNTLNRTNQSTENALIDTEDLFAMYTQPVSKNIPPKEKPNKMTLMENEEHQDKDEVSGNDDVFNATTQKMPKATAIEPTFTKPMAMAKKRKSSAAHNDSDSFFEIATQPIGQQAVGNESLNDEDIFDMLTQRVINDDVYDAATQLQLSQSDAASQLQPETNDIFDAPTQRLNVQNESESPEPESSSSSGIQSGAHRFRAFESQLSPVLTPEWSMAKLIPKNPTNVVEKSISKKEENLKRKQQWLFNTSDDDSDNNDDDLDFDLTPNRQNDSVRLSMLGSSNDSKSATRKMEPEKNSKAANREKNVEQNLDNETPISNNDSKPAKRTRSLSIVLSRNEVSGYLKSGCNLSVSSSSIEKSRQKTESKPNETSTPKNDEKTKKRTETASIRGSVPKTEPKASKAQRTTPKEVPVTRNLRKKINNNSPIGKDDKNTLKRKSDEIDTDDQKQPRKRATKETESKLPWKYRADVTEKKITKNDVQKKEEKTKQPAKETKNSRTKIDKPAKTAPAMRQNPSHSLLTSIPSRRQSNRVSRPNSAVDLPVNILFTKINPKPHMQNIKSLGGFIVDTPQLGTILICDTASRTFKFLYAIIKGIPIVTSKWLDASYKAGTFVPVTSFLLTDVEAEKRFHFSLKASLEISRRIKLFEKYKFMATPHSQPVPNEIAELVRCGGGEFVFNPSEKFEANDRVVLVSEKDDNRLWRKYQRIYGDIMIVSSEGFMQSILQHKINFKHYILR